MSTDSTSRLGRVFRIELVCLVLIALATVLANPSPSLADPPEPGTGKSIRLPQGPTGTLAFTTPITLTGGGSSEWTVSPKSGTNDGTPTGTVDETHSGLGIVDASISTPSYKTDAFDYGLMLWVNNQQVQSNSFYTLTRRLRANAPSAMSGLYVQVEYYVAQYTSTLRTLASFSNPTASPISVPVYWATNVGSDTFTGVRGTSSGDLTFTKDDRWVVTSDDPTTPGDPVNTHVLFGPGSPAVTPTSVTQVVHTYGGNQGIGATFNITVPAYSNRRLLFFNQLSDTNEHALGNAATFNTNPPLGGDLLNGIPHPALMEVLNWKFPNTPPVAVDDNVFAFSGGSNWLHVLDNDYDPDSDPLGIASVTVPSHGTASIKAPYISYTPTVGFSGIDHLGYTASDGQGGTASAQVTVTVGSTSSTTLPFDILSGVGDTSVWHLEDSGGTDNGLPTGGSYNSSPGLTVMDAELGSHGDAFDNGLTLWVNNTIVTATSPVTVGLNHVTSGPVTMGGLAVTADYQGLSSSDTLRTLLSLRNPTGSAIAVTVTLATNVGSDASTGVRGSSSGDLSFTKDDRWVVTSDDAFTPSDAVNTHVLFGPGAPAVKPLAVSQTVFSGSTTDGILAQYTVTVPAGATRRLLFFNQLHLTNEAAVTDAAAFNVKPTGALLAGLSLNQLTEIVNWDFRQAFLPLTMR